MCNLSKETINVERIGKTKEFGVGRVKSTSFISICFSTLNSLSLLIRE